MSDHSTKPLHTHCQNCGTELKGPYCHSCGQHDFDFHKSWGHVIHETLEGFFHFDGKLFRGLFDLLFRPGWLTASFNQGKRASQVPPLRFYIFVSLVFFLTPSLSHGPAPAASTEGTRIHLGTTPAAGTPANRVDIQLDDQELDRRIRERLSNPAELEERFTHYLPRMLLACLPVFALISLGVFRKAGLTYLQHLVWALHLHTFFYLFYLVAAGWRMLAAYASPLAANLLGYLFAAYLVTHPVLAMRRVFGATVKGAVVRGFLLMCLYGLVLAAGLAVTAVLAVVLA